MAYDFTPTDHLDTTSTPVSTLPLTLSCWFNADDVIAQQGIFGVYASTVGAHYVNLVAYGPGASDPLVGAIVGDSGGQFCYATGYSVSTWHHACFVVTSGSSYTVYLDGSTDGTNTNNIGTPNNLDSISVGWYNDSTPGLPFNGRVCECGLWNVALSTSEVDSLAAGASPEMVRPSGLKWYRSLIRDLVHPAWGGDALSETGSPTVATHYPQIIYPIPRPVPTFPAAAAGFVPYPNPRYAMAGGHQNMGGGIAC